MLFSCIVELNPLMCICSIVLIVCGHDQQDGSAAAQLEFTSKGGSVQVNGKKMEKNSKVLLSSGDEVIFSTSGKYAYVSFWFVRYCDCEMCAWMYIILQLALIF